MTESESENDVRLPDFFTLRQTLKSRRVPCLEQELRLQLRAHASSSENFAGSPGILSGKSVAVAVGSRGIDRIDEATRTVVQFLRQAGADPFIVPAMGSHGGATAEGQTATLESLGITADSIGCPIRSSMETVLLGHSPDGLPLFFDRNAFHADHVVVINRIKPHTKLTGRIQSGLCKMLMIGLGKREGPTQFHPAFKSMDYRLDRVTGGVIPIILNAVPFLFGVALIEDAHDAVGEIAVLGGDALLAEEPKLLTRAATWMPKLPFDAWDLLIIDSIGKEISGTGMDTNVVGRKWHDKVAGEDETPKVDEIFVRSLSARTAGNATGIGIAEYTHRRVFEDIDRAKTRINCITAGHPTAAAVPVWFDSDREVLDAICLQSPMSPSQRRWGWISNTLDLSTVRCSAALLPQARDRDDLEVIHTPEPLKFDETGNLLAGDPHRY